MDSLVALEIIAAGDGCLKIDDARIRPGLIEGCQRITPDIIPRHRPGDRSIGPLGQVHVSAGVADVGFVQRRIAGAGQDLIDSAAGHHISA